MLNSEHSARNNYVCISTKLDKNLYSVFNPVNRMHRSSSGSFWISCTLKSTADHMFAEQGRSQSKSTPDLGVCYRGNSFPWFADVFM